MHRQTRPMSSAPARNAYDVLQISPTAHQQVVRAAYRALARIHHPDADRTPDADARMAELNQAYASLITPERRAEYDRQRAAIPVTGTTHPSAPGHVEASSPASGNAGPVPPPERPPADVIDFGRYAGWKIGDLAKRDPDYLRWLSRHSSGIRFRRTIAEALARQVVGPAPVASGRRR